MLNYSKLLKPAKFPKIFEKGYTICMEKLMQFIKGVLFLSYVFGLYLIVLKKDYLSSLLELPDYVVPIIAFVGIFFVAYRSVISHIKINRLESEFTTIVNHTFRTPLTRVMWFTKELEKDLSMNEKLLYLQNITNATNKVLEIVDLFVGIKNINDTAGYFFEATSLRDIVEKSIVKYREEINKKNISFQVSTFKDVPLLTLDLKKISFVIDTLIENAIFYTPKGGKVLIDSISNAQKLTVYVSDTGIGLGWMDKMRIFSRFFRTKKSILMNPDGMGLKLYLSKIIIRRHKGKLYAKSKGIDKGTVFFVELPYNTTRK